VTAEAISTAPFWRGDAGLDTDGPVWRQWLRSERVSLPRFSSIGPTRCVFSLENRRGSAWYAWEPGAGAPRELRALRGTGPHAVISRDGRAVWWFDDLFGDQAGRWRRAPFDGGESREALPEAPDAGAEGAVVGMQVAAVSLAVPGRGCEIHVSRSDEDPGRRVFRRDTPVHMAGLSADETLLCLMDAEHGDPRRPRLRVIDLDGDGVSMLWDGPGLGLEIDTWLPCFSPKAGDQRILVRHERHGWPALLLWSALTGATEELDFGLSGELTGGFTPDGTGLLVLRRHRGRGELYRYDFGTGSLTAIEDRPGVVDNAASLPDGSVWYSWSSPYSPPAVYDQHGSVVLGAAPREPSAGPAAPTLIEAPVLIEAVREDGDPVPAMLRMPAGVDGPAPAVFLLHGGPRAQDGEEFSAEALAWLDAGFAVVGVNYRGSIGYGCRWRDAVVDQVGQIGLAEVADIDGVRGRLVERSLIDPARCALVGGSWGGYLALLGAGVQPDRWSCVVATNPIADYAAAFRTETDVLRAFDRVMFGGTPDDVPERYRAASPATYVDRLRAPVMVIAGAADTRCPPEQVRSYVDLLRARGLEVEFNLHHGGHGAVAGADELRQFDQRIDFVRRTIGTGRHGQ
jgi:dipeptidyl aminopeptidase/acylaminoacyl peptidase